MYNLIFKEKGQIVQVQKGYTSRSEARLNAKELDLMIPFTWDVTVEKEEKESDRKMIDQHWRELADNI